MAEKGSVHVGGYVAMVLLAVQFGLQPILYKEFAGDATHPSILVIACELCKFLIALTVLLGSGKARSVFASWRWGDSFHASGLPACTYAMQNVLVQIAYQHLPPIVFNLINQTKLLWTAVFLFILMGKRFSIMQCFAMLLLLAAAVILSLAKDGQTTDSGDSTNTRALDFQFGLLPVILASMLSGIGAALTQQSMQIHRRETALVAMELAFYGSIFLVVPVFLPENPLSASSSLSTVPYTQWFEGWDQYTCIPIFANALGGLLVGAVTKQVGGVLKSFALICGIAFTAVVESYLYNVVLPTQVWTAAILVAVSMYLYSAYPAASTTSSTKKEN